MLAGQRWLSENKLRGARHVGLASAPLWEAGLSSWLFPWPLGQLQREIHVRLRIPTAVLVQNPKSFPPLCRPHRHSHSLSQPDGPPLLLRSTRPGPRVGPLHGCALCLRGSPHREPDAMCPCALGVFAQMSLS